MKINITNTEKLNKAIAEAEGKATSRTVTCEDIQKICTKISCDIPKCKLDGTKIYYNGAQHFPNAYKYRAYSTHWVAENRRGNWYVVSISRNTCPNKYINTVVEYSDAAKESILNKASNLTL